MIESLDLSKTISKEEYKEKKEKLAASLCEKQRLLWEAKVSTIIVIEGFDGAGKGEVINELILPMTPKAFCVRSKITETENEIFHPYMWKFWERVPEKGNIDIFEQAWYKRVWQDRFSGITKKKELPIAFDEINSFEKMMVDDGVIVLKFMLVISKKEQKKRLKKLYKNIETRWRVTKEDLLHNKQYDEYARICDEMLTATDTKDAPWTLVEAEDDRYAALKVMSEVEKAFSERLESLKNPTSPVKNGKFLPEGEYELHALNNVDLTKSLTKEEYKVRMKKVQNELKQLHGVLYAMRIPVVLGFEGWDAAGKGGAIHRLTEALDPRGYKVSPTSSPNDTERAHHYLWRFWTKMPKDGHIAIFDRTWYGRVMVERIEGFCSVDEWERAYREINDMEKQLADHGAIVIKFWLHIDKDEQKKRFENRQNTPGKEWKITDEDWRNREKWPQYEQAVDDMLIKTSTPYAPWVIVEGNNKYYARVKVLETVAQAIKDKIKEELKKPNKD
ncbi:MAG: polyphosphate:AMP phosphotransferase [Lachnospiraceae bacterium]|nr:polyphosphate:AMP phosphotransferase [Lachnospiraceae bacterium]